MGEMISMIAHQWRQPLAAISSTSIGLLIKLDLKSFDLKAQEGRDAYEKYFADKLRNINGYVHNLTTTIDDFRDFYKPNKEPVTMRLEDVIVKSLSIIEETLENDNIEIKKEYNSNELIRLYDNEMMQVILNILKNASDNFKEKQIKDPYIKISTEHRKISICDNGGGISRDIKEKIFDPYFSTKSEKNGTGLGLYMSKTIVENHHNGILNIKNILKSGKVTGVCFTIEFPINGKKKVI